ncbi:MAG TPA: ATP-binding protein [Pyrinomonadaceae bacterium]
MSSPRYVGRVSGPLLDRIDIHVDVPAVRFRELSDKRAPEGESSADIRGRVLAARERQRTRFGSEGIFANALMTPRLVRRHCRLGPEGERLLETAMTRQGLSARAYDRIPGRGNFWPPIKLQNRCAQCRQCKQSKSPEGEKA